MYASGLKLMYTNEELMELLFVGFDSALRYHQTHISEIFMHNFSAPDSNNRRITSFAFFISPFAGIRTCASSPDRLTAGFTPLSD